MTTWRMSQNEQCSHCDGAGTALIVHSLYGEFEVECESCWGTGRRIRSVALWKRANHVVGWAVLVAGALLGFTPMTWATYRAATQRYFVGFVGLVLLKGSLSLYVRWLHARARSEQRRDGSA